MNNINKRDYYKIHRPFSIYKAKAMEDYFKFMSKQGKHIVDLSEGFFDGFAFEEGIPLDKKYKLLLTKQKNLSEKLKLKLRGLGLEYVCSGQPKFRRQRFHLFEAKTENVDYDIIDSKNKKVAFEFQHSNILSVLTSRMTIVGLAAFIFIILTLDINNEKGRNVAAAILAIAIISEVAKYYFELGYEKEYIEEVASEEALVEEWETEKQRYDRKEIILRIVFVIAMLIPILILRF